MHPIWANVAALAVAVIYYLWRAFEDVRRRRERTLRARVAYMLWVMATHGRAESRVLRRVTA